MASLAVYDPIRARIEAGWTTTPIHWENEDFDKPEPPAPFIAVELTGTLYGQESIGAGLQAANRWDEEGTLWMHVFVPVGTGTRLIRAYAKTLADLFRGAQLASDHLEFMDATIGMGEPGDDNGVYYRVSVDVKYRYVEA